MTTGPATVLVADDDPVLSAMIRDLLVSAGLSCVVAADPQQAMDLLGRQHFDVLVADICMPGITGLDLLLHAKKNAPDCKVILVSGLSTTRDVAQAIVCGAYDYIQKPFSGEELRQAVARAVRPDSAPYLPTRAASAVQLESRSKQAALDVIRALVCAVETKDPYTRRHSEQVAHYATHLAARMNLPRETIETVYAASMLHDVGKIGVPDGILTKPGALTSEEFESIRRHPALGETIVGNIACFASEARLVRHHHENWNGTGYPDGLTGEEIPVGARLIRIADAMDAMLMHRSYKQAYPVEKMIDELIRCAGADFDPRLAAVAVEWCRINPDKLVLPGEPVRTWQQSAR